MSSLEEISQILAKTTTAQVSEAEAQLASLREDPNFFSQLLTLITSISNETIKKAAVIQMKYSLISHPELVEQFPLETFCQLFDSSNFDFQNILEFISDTLIKFNFENNPSEVISFIASLIPNGNSSAFCLLFSLISDNNGSHDLHNNLIPLIASSIEYFNQTIKTNIGSDIYQNSLLHFAKTTQNVLTFATEIPPEIYENIFQFCFAILAVAPQIPNLNITTPLLNNLCNVIYSAFLNFKDNDELPPLESFSSIPETLISYLGHLPDNSKANIFNILNMYFSIDPLYALIEENVDTIIGEVIIPTFKHDPETIFQIEPYEAIDILLPQESEEETSVGAAAKILRDNASKLASNVLEICLSYDLSTEDNVFACLFALSCIAKQFGDADIEKLNPFIELVQQCFTISEFFACSALVFLSGLPIIDHNVIHELCMQSIQIMTETENKVILYLAIVAATNLLSSCESQKETIFDAIGENITGLIEIVFQMNQEFQTDYMGQSLIKFTEYFAPIIHNFANDYVQQLISLFGSYMEGDSSEARTHAGLFITAIDNVLKSAVDQPEITGPLCIQLLQFISDTNEEIEDTFYEEFIQIMRTCACYSPEFTEELAMIPSKLYEYIEEEDELIEDAAPVIRILLQRFPESINNEPVNGPISSILELILSEEEIYDNYWDGLVYILQALFIICGNSEFSQNLIGNVLEMIGDEREISTKGVATSLVTCNPILALSHENIAMSWLQNHTPAAFLQSAIVVLSNWDSLPDDVKSLEEQIRNQITECKSELQSEKVPQIIDPFNFADPSETDDWILYNKDEILSNPILK